MRNSNCFCSISRRICGESLLNLAAFVGREESDVGEHLGMGDRGGDIVRVEPAIEAHAFGELLDASVGRFVEHAPPGFFGHECPFRWLDHEVKFFTRHLL